MRSQRRAILKDNGVHPHDPVVEQVGLHHAATIHRAAVAQPHQIRLGQPIRFAPHTSANLGTQRP
jgi:hypothetical protein